MDTPEHSLGQIGPGPLQMQPAHDSNETQPATTLAVRKGGRKKLSRVCPYCNKVFTRHNKLTAHINERRCRRSLSTSLIQESSFKQIDADDDDDLEGFEERLVLQSTCQNPMAFYRGRPDPDVHETRHILECSTCWRKVARDMFSRQWLNDSLNAALKYNNPVLVSHLINAGADPEYVDGTHSVFQYAVLKGCESRIIKILCSRGANPDQLVEDVCGDTALHIACSDPDHFDSSAISHILTLLDLGASASISNTRMELPIHNFLFACPKSLNGCRKVLEALIMRTNKHGQYLNHQNFEGSTPLHLAAEYCPQAIPFLLQYHADPNIKNKEGFLPIHLMSSPDSLTELAEATVGGLRAVNDEGFNLLHIAAFRADHLVVRRILELDKPMVHLRNIAQRTGLLTALESSAILENRLETARAFVEFGADVNACDVEGNTALHLAISNIQFQLDWTTPINDGPAMSEFVRGLVEKGAKVSEPNSRGRTPLGILLQNFLRIKDGLLDIDRRVEVIGHPRHGGVAVNPKEELKRVETKRGNLVTEIGELTKFLTILRLNDAVVSPTELEQLSPLLHQSYLLGNALVAILNSAITMY